ncbi:sporulation integral membrane protein YtvI [Pseudobacillus badius]|uniref:sporulation integral membrane protein YtvI n=1 Tax=Bacillus badius TaxID=1455 RepID=UPI0024A05E0F|nr:sporulation integral membrane protein YtvI [Bacillus badius]MED0666457.1 sporulation integral membrane protein YtvI [Bacillus badius]GLY10247.1 permease [Bacillus badius]
MHPSSWQRLIRLFIVVVSAVLLILSLYYIAKITYPFIIGFAVAFLIKPFIRFLEVKLRLPRAAASGTAILLILAVFAGGMTLLIAEIVSGANYFASVVPRHIYVVVEQIETIFASQVIPLYERAAGIFHSLDTGQQETIASNIREAGEQVASTAGAFIQDFFLKLPKLISWIPSFATALIFSFLAAFFISKDWESLQQRTVHYLPLKARTSLSKVFFALRKALFGFLRAQFTLISITTFIVLAGLLILRVNYAITLALVAGLVDLLPYLGTGTLFVPWIIYEFIAGETGLAIGLTVLYVIIIVQRQIMEPKVLSSSIGLDPLATLIALFVGFKLAGFFGLILGPIALVIINALHNAGVFIDLRDYIMGKEVPPAAK